MFNHGRRGVPRERRSARSSFLPKPVIKVRDFFTRTIWQDEPAPPPGPAPAGAPRAQRTYRSYVYPFLRVLWLVVRGFFDHDLATRAAALSFVTILALVPSLAVAFSLFQAFKGLEGAKTRVQDIVYSYLPEHPEVRERIRTLIDGAITNIQAGAQENALVATIVLFVTVVVMLSRLEESFNSIWGIKRSRSVFQRFTAYWAVATLGPVLFGASIAMTASLRSTHFVRWLESTLPVVEVLYRLAPFVLTAFAFALLYLFMPHTKVRIGAAIIGGLVGAILFELGKWGFTIGSAYLLASYNRIYTGIAALFIFLFWLNLCWLIVLVGLEVTLATQTATAYAMDELAARVNHRGRELVALRIATEVACRFGRGNDPPTADVLAKALHAPLRLVHDVLGLLEEAGLVRAVEVGKDELGYVAGRPLDKVSLADVSAVLRERDGVPLTLCKDDDTTYLESLLAEAEVAVRGIYGRESLKGVAERMPACPSAGVAARDGNGDAAPCPVDPAPVEGASAARAPAEAPGDGPIASDVESKVERAEP